MEKNGPISEEMNVAVSFTLFFVLETTLLMNIVFDYFSKRFNAAKRFKIIPNAFIPVPAM